MLALLPMKLLHGGAISLWLFAGCTLGDSAFVLPPQTGLAPFGFEGKDGSLPLSAQNALRCAPSSSGRSRALFSPAPERETTGSLCSCGAEDCPWRCGGVRLFSPCKANLFLKVLPRPSEKGGSGESFHELLSLFQALSLGDTVYVHLLPPDFRGPSDPRLEWRPPLEGGGSFDHLSFSDEGDVCFSSAALGCSPRRNLIFKAVNFFRRRCLPDLAYGWLGLDACLPFPPRFLVHLAKRVPMRAGLGGGSSNAATAIHACGLLCCGGGLGRGQQPHLRGRHGRSLGFSNPRTLHALSREVGADVPFFLLSKGAALCSGVGEQVRDCTDSLRSLLRQLGTGGDAEPLFVVVKGDGGLKTKAVFSAFDAAYKKRADSADGWDFREAAAERLLRGAEFSTSTLAVEGEPEAARVLQKALMQNDLFLPATQMMPSLLKTHSALEKAFLDDARTRGEDTSLLHSGLTGSGAALVGVVKSDFSLQAVRKGLSRSLGEDAAKSAFLKKCKIVAKRPLYAKVLSAAQMKRLLTSELSVQNADVSIQHCWFAEDDASESRAAEINLF